MALIVKKFGGSSVASPEKIYNVVDRVLRDKKEDDRVVVVVSAMGDTTDDLVSLARAVTSRPFGREMDRLLSTGEQISIALVAMAFMEKGQPAVSMTGAQAGILSSDNHGKGRILNIDPSRVFAALDAGNVVVVAGFQGITDCGDITTLGRGGSDTTAVALAGAMQADVCEIFTDVEGVYSTDPRIAPNAVKLDEITYGEMLEMARLGAGVMQPRAVEMGSRYGVPIHVRSTFSDKEGTIIREDYTMEANKHVIQGVADDTNVAKVSLVGVKNKPGIAHLIFQSLADKNVDVDMIVQSIRTVEDTITDIVFTITLDDVVIAREVLEALKAAGNIEEFVINEKMAKVSIVGAGMLGQPGVAAQMFGILSEENINIEIISTSEISITCLIAEDRVKDAIRAIHDNLVIDKRG
ncbi:aspartate kinase [Veillonella sp. R32]|uniref:aspartate kinase n=1 Tax=Veillonella sp. R32 TaxID=2021312 RepID=UPI0013895480|nr:aspartate kinase [Veillonella sp. R32]KAF1682917.1 aspartate kinase [Veillonella sp. R32]